MKRNSVKIERLFEAVRPLPREAPEEMPAHLQTRVLAHWRSAPAAESTSQLLAVMFRRAAIFAGVVMLMSILYSYGALTHGPESDVEFANYQLQQDLRP